MIHTVVAGVWPWGTKKIPFPPIIATHAESIGSQPLAISETASERIYAAIDLEVIPKSR